MKIQILDCTLRDGAHINDGDFGEECIKVLVSGLVESKIDIIEVGLLQDCKSRVGCSIFNSIELVDDCLSAIDKGGAKFALLLRSDRCDFGKLAKATKVDFVRIALYREHLKDTLRYAARLKELGYGIFFNPIAITQYTPREIEALIGAFKGLEPYRISLVDTFGAFKMREFDKTLQLFSENLSPKTKLGIHLHQNLGLGLALAMRATENAGRDIVVDCSLNGMGRIPGNLQSELFASFLNDNFNAHYNVEKLLALSALLEDFKRKDAWGYNPIYMYSATLNIDRNYPEFFAKLGFRIEQNLALQQMCKIRGYGRKFSEKYANEVAEEFRGL